MAGWQKETQYVLGMLLHVVQYDVLLFMASLLCPLEGHTSAMQASKKYSSWGEIFVEAHAELRRTALDVK